MIYGVVVVRAGVRARVLDVGLHSAGGDGVFGRELEVPGDDGDALVIVIFRADVVGRRVRG